MKNRLECMQSIRFLAVLLMCCLSYTTWAQTQSNVNGLVTDFSGEPLIGVSILVKGTSNGTVTDLDGKFSLSAEMGNMLQISYVGYISQEVKVESDKLLRIIMEEDTKKLEEVVVVGYGTQKKVNLTGAVSAVSAEDLASKPVMSTAQALAGLAPGLSVLQTSGRPGQGATVKIRGTGTFSKAGTDPLVLIDGLSGNIDDVDPNDIQSISFLKDAASASIYGNRAANGVILIETKKGAQGKTTITYSNSFGWQQPTELPDFLPSWEYAEYYNMAMRNMGKQEAYLPEQIQKYRDGSDPDNYPNVNHLKWLLESGSGFQHQHNLSIQGGNATTSYNLSVGYRNQEGMTAKTSNERMTALFTMKSEIAKGLMLNLNINAYNNKYNAPNGEPQSIDGMIGYAVRQGPIYAGQKSDGSFGYQDIQTPTFEFFDVFGREIGTTPSKELYKFFDKEGNTLVLRPDFTPSIARSAAKYFMDETIPLRFCYSGNNYINTSNLQGKLKETTQMGAELIGDASAEADAEMIALLIKSLLNVGLKEFQVSVGQVDYFKGLCSHANLDEDTELALREFISNRKGDDYRKNMGLSFFTVV